MLVYDHSIDGTEITSLSPSSEKRVVTKCDTCGKQSSTTFANYNNSQIKRGFPGTTYCRACVCKISAEARKGKPAHNKGKKLPANKKGENHASWKGGRYISSDGYYMIRVEGKGWGGYRKEHAILIEKKIGRSLCEDEAIHHIDGNKLNNDPSNLWLTTSKSHRNAHTSLQRIGFELYSKGLIGFDTELGTYFWKE